MNSCLVLWQQTILVLVSFDFVPPVHVPKRSENVRVIEVDAHVEFFILVQLSLFWPTRIHWYLLE